MPFSFGKSPKSPGEIVRNLKDNIAHMERLDAADRKCEKVGPPPPPPPPAPSLTGKVALLNVDCCLFTFQVAEEASKNLASLKEVVCGSTDKDPQPEAVAQLAQELYKTDLLISLIANLQKIDFEVGTPPGSAQRKAGSNRVCAASLYRERRTRFSCSATS